jgi:hypothetical protein
MTEYRVKNDVVVLSQAELNAFDDMLKAGDRAGFYMTYYAMTDSAESLLQAKVATFSGLTGGAASPQRVTS